MVLVLHLLRSFLKYLCEHPRVRLTFLKVDVLNLLTSPGAFEIFVIKVGFKVLI